MITAVDKATLLEVPTRGEIPSLINPPQGCRFHPRCPHVMPVCKQQFPQRTDLGDGHWTNCFLYTNEAARAAHPAAEG